MDETLGTSLLFIHKFYMRNSTGFTNANNKSDIMSIGIKPTYHLLIFHPNMHTFSF